MDIVLVRKAIKGNKKAFDKLIKEVSLDGYRLAYYYMKHETDSQDVLGLAIEKAYLKINTLKEPNKFKAWFLTIVVNEAKMKLRKKASSKVVSIDMALNLPEEEKDKEALLDLENALGHLKSDDRSLLMMKYYEGYTFKEIGKIHGIPESTVKTRTYDLLKKLRKDLEGKENSYVKVK